MKKSSCHHGFDPQPCSGREQRKVTNPCYQTLPSQSKPVPPPKPQRKKEASSGFPSNPLQLWKTLSTPQLYDSGGNSTMLAPTELDNSLDTPPTPPPHAHLRPISRDRPIPTPRAHRSLPPPLPRQSPTQSPSPSPRSDWHQPSVLPVREPSSHPVHHPPSAPLSCSTTRVPPVSVSTPASVSSPRSAPGTPLLVPHTHHSALAVLTLGELAEQPDHLPATIETIDGFYGFGSQFTISTGDQLSVHFAKNTKVVTLQDHLGMEYNVPLSSAMKFGLVREPTETPEIFEKVSDILAQTRHLPPVICAQQSVPRRGKYNGVEEGEILIIQLKPASSRSGLACYSLTTNKEKTLHGDCKGHFTTAPEKTIMYLLDILSHLQNTLPCKVRLYPPTTNKKYEGLISGKIFTLKDCTTKTSLVVSNVTSDESGELFDILLDEDLSELRVSVFDTQHVGEEVQNKEDFSGSVTHGQYTVLTNTPSRFASRFQNSLYFTIRRGFETEGIEVASRHMRGKVKLQVVDEDKDGYTQVRDHLYTTVGERCSPSKPPVKKNKEYLASLSMYQVLELLNAMKMEQYRSAFIRERMTGDVLAECDEQVLQQELGVSKKLHRIRLLQIISGERSAESLLSRQNL